MTESRLIGAFFPSPQKPAFQPNIDGLSQTRSRNPAKKAELAPPAAQPVLLAPPSHRRMPTGFHAKAQGARSCTAHTFTQFLTLRRIMIIADE
jgi:hypothetical protein